MDLPKGGLRVLGRNGSGIFQEGLCEQEATLAEWLQWAPADDSGVDETSPSVSISSWKGQRLL